MNINQDNANDGQHQNMDDKGTARCRAVKFSHCRRCPPMTAVRAAKAAGISAEAQQRDKTEWSGGVPLCRYVSRPAVS